MGNSSSAGTQGGRKQLSQVDKDIQYLANRHPFGDEELHHIYRAYQSRQMMETRRSFLTDIGVLTFSGRVNAGEVPPTEGTSEQTNKREEERLILMQAIEQKVLPKGFGNRWYETAFLRDGDISDYNSLGDHNKEAEHDTFQVQSSIDSNYEYTRVAKLERFFEGLSNCGRRGANETLKVLIACCQPQPAPPEEVMSMETPDSFSPHAAGTTKQSKTVWIEPLEFVEMGYRVALATAFLQAAARDDEDVGRFLPPEQKEDDKPNVAIQALAKSLIDNAKRRRRQSQYLVSNNNAPDTDLVNESDVLEWAESVAPLFASSLATFTHNIFFPRRPYPPSRTSFDYPRISDESTFFCRSSSPLLFGLGCMSSSLSGEVS